MAPLQEHAIQQFREKFRGITLLPGDHGYDSERKIWNGMFDRKPALIARCLGTSDVVNALRFARHENLLISVRGGGHNSAGKAVCDDGIMIDLSLMRRVNVDPRKKTARVDGGALLGDVDYETQLYGLAVSSGIVSHTGVGGLTLGGGFGWISRKYGFSVDNLLSATVVTVDGEVLTASSEENEDLFWGIRGGGGNFGIVTSFEFRCADIGTEVYSGVIVKKFEDTRRFIQFYRDYVLSLPDEMTIWMVLRHAPPLPFLPKDVHGEMVLLVPFVWLGDEREGANIVRPVQDISDSHAEMICMHNWLQWQSAFDNLNLPGSRNYWKSHHLKELSNNCIDKIIDYAVTMPTDDCEVFIPHMGGAPSRVPAGESAFAHRSTPFVLNIHTRWRDQSDDAECITWARDFHQSTEAFSQGVYVNFLSDEGSDRVKKAYTNDVWERLVQIKNKYDPNNLLRMNQNIQPSL